MSFDIAESLEWTRQLTSIAIFIQAVENLFVKPWPWGLVRRDFGKLPFGFLMGLPGFWIVRVCQIFLAVSLWFSFHPWIVTSLFVITFLICLRWRGTFNGGSDFMSLILLMALTIASFAGSSSKIAIGCLWYIGIQSISSYFISGVTKLKQPEWRNGTAPIGFVNSSIYGPMRMHVPRFAGILTLSFECSFPIALLDPRLAILYCSLGGFFHMGNAYTLGLNRFFFVWIATYPTILYCAHALQGH